MQLQFKLNMINDAWYPTLDLNEIKSTTGGAVDIKEKLVIVFSAPGKITAGDINVETNPWKSLGIKVESTDVGGGIFGNDSNLLIVFYVQIMPDDLVMQLHRF